MKTISMISLFPLLVSFLVSTANANLNIRSCTDNKTQGGVDILPWSLAQPFPWDNIQGFWKLGDDQSSYLSAQILSSTSKRKILSLSVHGEGVCSKPYAKGTGYIDVSEKNVVRALVSDGYYKYQLKLAMFDSRDVYGFTDCSQNIMGVSMQVVGRTKKSKGTNPAPLEPDVTETHNMMLKKVTIDVVDTCKKIN